MEGEDATHLVKLIRIKKEVEGDVKVTKA